MVYKNNRVGVNPYNYKLYIYIYINYIRRLIKLLNYILYKMSDKQM